MRSSARVPILLLSAVATAVPAPVTDSVAAILQTDHVRPAAALVVAEPPMPYQPLQLTGVQDRRPRAPVQSVDSRKDETQSDKIVVSLVDGLFPSRRAVSRPLTRHLTGVAETKERSTLRHLLPSPQKRWHVRQISILMCNEPRSSDQNNDFERRGCKTVLLDIYQGDAEDASHPGGQTLPPRPMCYALPEQFVDQLGFIQPEPGVLCRLTL